MRETWIDLCWRRKYDGHGFHRRHYLESEGLNVDYYGELRWRRGGSRSAEDQEKGDFLCVCFGGRGMRWIIYFVGQTWMVTDVAGFLWQRCVVTSLYVVARFVSSSLEIDLTFVVFISPHGGGIKMEGFFF